MPKASKGICVGTTSCLILRDGHFGFGQEGCLSEEPQDHLCGLQGEEWGCCKASRSVGEGFLV